ncbi:hypothetical protein Scep_016948 [Stephania cephalantha]|uniref:NAC domain-containing protein n=1 Tax=Stephania cephalantha TaxID=152367 RepID=A0AAP0NV64_9MAGN
MNGKRPIWLVDSNRIATKIKSASGTYDPKRTNWKSNPTRACPSCNHIIDNSDVAQDWPGLPRGVKFDPSDPEIIWHLIAKVGTDNIKPHPFIEEFMPTVNEDDGICYTHPEKLPGVKKDGSVSHFFHRAINAYNTGTRKRRKVHGDILGDVRWHKTGKTKPVILDGVQRGCKKIMVLYMNMARGGKSEKTNWVMHQYHLGTGEEEKDGEYIVSKIFYQQQGKPGDKAEQDLLSDATEVVTNVDPITPKSSTPEPPRVERRHSDLEPGEAHGQCYIVVPAEVHDSFKCEFEELPSECGVPKDHGDIEVDNANWWEGESQFLLDSQQLVEGLSLCDELLESSQPESGDGVGKERTSKPLLSDYSRIGAQVLKEDLEACQQLGQKNSASNVDQAEAHDLKQNKEGFHDAGKFDPSNIELDTPPELRLSQLVC